jgi:hypothetical protein
VLIEMDGQKAPDLLQVATVTDGTFVVPGTASIRRIGEGEPGRRSSPRAPVWTP